MGEDSQLTLLGCAVGATAAFTGFHRATVSRHGPDVLQRPEKQKTMKEMGKKERARHIASKLTMPQRAFLVKEIHNIWADKKYVRVESLWEWAKANISYKYKKTYFFWTLKGLGFVFRKLNNMTVVEERPDIAKLRVAYLKKKKDMDESNAFYGAFDETWVHDGMAPTSGWQHANTTMYKKARMVDIESAQSGPAKGKQRGKRGIVLAILTEDGVLPGSEEILVDDDDENNQKADYHGVMDSNKFKEYMSRCIPEFSRLAASKGRPGVFIIDNAPYHNATREKPPTQTSKKADIQQWLKNNGVSYEAKAKKPELMGTLKNFLTRNGGRQAFTVYEFDEWADEVEGVKILRLPPYHCYWNPIEFLWAQMKATIRGMGSVTDSLPIVKK
uniref:Tc1-like transposase DDE domain-containing protein n=1 Tax=Caenorhabditis japonica TaxID=281687 RepID=A0A8R1I013_CAEJA